jgi:hypothetical protein
MADHSVEIQKLEAILAGGVTSTTVDGLTVTRDLAEVRRRLAELRAEDDATIEAGKTRQKMVPYRW